MGFFRGPGGPMASRKGGVSVNSQILGTGRKMGIRRPQRGAAPQRSGNAMQALGKLLGSAQQGAQGKGRAVGRIRRGVANVQSGMQKPKPQSLGVLAGGRQFKQGSPFGMIGNIAKARAPGALARLMKSRQKLGGGLGG